MQSGVIRPLAIGIFRHDGKILVGEGYDSVKAQTFYRPLGGKIEFGERGIETLYRELREELQAEIADVRYLGTLESIFVCDGRPGHQIVMVYEARFVTPEFYNGEVVSGVEDDGTPFRAVWFSLAEFKAGAAPLYPDGLLELIS